MSTSFAAVPPDAWVVHVVHEGRSMQRLPVVGFLTTDDCTEVAVLNASSGSVMPVSRFVCGPWAVVEVTRPDVAPRPELIEVAHCTAVEPAIDQAWRAFHVAHGHDACGRWSDEDDPPPAATELRDGLVRRFRLTNAEFAMCPHWSAGCGVEIGCTPDQIRADHGAEEAASILAEANE